MTKRRIYATPFTIALLTAILATGVHANGYKILGVKSTKATGMGEAFVVQADDPSAIAFNPAGLWQLRGNQASFQATLCNAYTEHTASDGETTDMKDKWQTVPAFYVTSDFGRNDLGAGLGVSCPNGLSSEWAKDSFARYVATYSDLQVVDISPAVGMRLTDNLRIGAAVDFYYSSARLESMADLGLQSGMPGAMDAESRMKGTGTAWGANIGVIYDFNSKHSVAVTYHLPYSIEYDGEYSLAAAGIKTDAKASIDFPPVAVFGYGYRFSDNWRAEFDLDWTGWNSVGDIILDFETPGMPDAVQKQDLRNTFAYKLGTEYAYSESWRLRCGYIYNENATKESSWRPSLPDTDMHFVTGGMGVDMGAWTLDLALQLVLYEKRHIDNNVDYNESRSSSSVDGTYRTWAPALSAGAGYKF